MDDIIVRIVPLPRAIKGFTMPDENGDYNIYLNDKLSDQELCDVYDHEMAHINSGHFYDDTKSVATKEREAHGQKGNAHRDGGTASASGRRATREDP